MPLPSPGTLVGLHIFSLITTLCMMVTCAFDRGILSLMCTPLFGVVTTIYNITSLLFYARRNRDRPPFIGSAYIALAYVLSFAWLITFVAMVFVYQSQVNRRHSFKLGALVLAIPYDNKPMQKVQFCLVPLEWVILGDLAIRNTFYRRSVWEAEKDAFKLPLHNEAVCQAQVGSSSCPPCLPQIEVTDADRDDFNLSLYTEFECRVSQVAGPSGTKSVSCPEDAA